MEQEAITIKTYCLYVARWGILAIPGAAFLVWVSKYITNTYLAMLASQIALGAIIFFVDKRIFRDRKVERVIAAAKEVVRCHHAKYSKYYKSLKIRELQQALDDLKEG